MFFPLVSFPTDHSRRFVPQCETGYSFLRDVCNLQWLQQITKLVGFFSILSLIILLVAFRSHSQGHFFQEVAPSPVTVANRDLSCTGDQWFPGIVPTNCKTLDLRLAPSLNPGSLKINSSCMQTFPKPETNLMVRGPTSAGRDPSKDHGNSWIQMIWSPGWA